MAAVVICSSPGCYNSVAEGGRCQSCRAAVPKRTRTDRRVRGRRGRLIAMVILRRDPYCRICKTAYAEEVDHIVPLSQGGHPTAQSNLAGVCRACHAKKSREERGGGKGHVNRPHPAQDPNTVARNTSAPLSKS